MFDPPSYRLQQWPEHPCNYQFHPKETVFHLLRAFSLFTQEVDGLRDTYTKLQEKWLGVNKELTQKIEEINKLTTYCNHIIKNISQGILWIHLDGSLQLINPAAQIYLRELKR